MNGDTVPASEVGIGDDSVRSELEALSNVIESKFGAKIDSTEVKNALIDGAAHVEIVFKGESVPTDFFEFLVNEGYHQIAPRVESDGRLRLHVTTTDIYLTIYNMGEYDPEGGE